MKLRALTLILVLAAFSTTPARAATPTDGGEPPGTTEPVAPLERRVAAFSTTALGLSGAGFVNELAGARFELGYTPRFTLAFGVAYANLKGKDGRASNVLPEAMLRYRIPISRVVGFPLHFASGYLPKNGPTLRLGAGFDFALGERVRLDLVLLEPMVWVTRNRPESSLDFGLALAVAL